MEGLTDFLSPGFTGGTKLDPHPYSRPGMALSGVSGLKEGLGVSVQLSLPWAHPTLDQSVPSVWPSVRSFRHRIDGPLTGEETHLGPTLPYFLPPAQSDPSQPNSKQVSPSSAENPSLAPPVSLGQSPNSSRPWRPSRSDPTPPPPLGAALKSLCSSY